MDWCSTHDFVLNKQKTQKWWLITINKSESVFCARFEFRTQTKVNKSQTQWTGDYNDFESKTVLNFEHGSENSEYATYLTQTQTPKQNGSFHSFRRL